MNHMRNKMKKLIKSKKIVKIKKSLEKTIEEK